MTAAWSDNDPCHGVRACATVDDVSDLDEIRSRMDALEAEVAGLREATADMVRLREDAAATRALAAMADRDASEVRSALRAHTQALSALRETQVEQSQTLQTVAELVGALAVGQQRHDQALTEQGQALKSLTEGQQRHDQALAEHGRALTDITEMLRRLTDGA